METYDCVVLSGGGAKGAYSAGVCKALSEYRKLKNINSEQCFIGTSSGALNACIVAALDEDKLFDFWKNKVTNNNILGTWIHDAHVQFLRRYVSPVRAISGKPFSIYPKATSRIRKLIESSVPATKAKEGEIQETLFSKLAGKHVIITATNYTTGRLRSFYASDLLDKFVKHDAKLVPDKRRLTHCEAINNEQELTNSMLASSAIPVFFPPVDMGGDLYIDGGVGNNTPTREAAYFMRFLDELKLGTVGHVYCVKLDPPQTLVPGKAKLGLTDILMRTLYVDQYVHMEPIISSWGKINKELQGVEEEIAKLQNWLPSVNVTGNEATQILNRIRNEVCRLGGPTKRLNLPITVIQPSGDLGDTLDFDPGRNVKNYNLGYTDMLKALKVNLEIKNKLSDAEYERLAAIKYF